MASACAMCHVNHPRQHQRYPRGHFGPRSSNLRMSSPPTTPTTPTTPASDTWEASQASTKVGSPFLILPEQDKSPRRRAFKRAQDATTAQDILLFLIAFRILNALSIRTFFQPDEYFQSLEPAWQMAFGTDSGAWITWVVAFTTAARPVGLIMRAGMETPSATSHTPSALRGGLLAMRGPVEGVPSVPDSPCGSHAGCAQGSASHLRGAGGLLYVEIGAEGIWTGEQRVVGSRR